MFKLEQANIDNPTEFWKSIAKLGPKTESGIPMEVKRDDGSVSDDLNEVLERWKSDFASLFASSDSYMEEQQAFVQQIGVANANRERVDDE